MRCSFAPVFAHKRTVVAAAKGGFVKWTQENPFWFQMIINLVETSGADLL